MKRLYKNKTIFFNRTQHAQVTRTHFYTCICTGRSADATLSTELETPRP